MVLSILAVVLIGLNLRAGITSAAPLFLDLQEFLGYGAFVAALLPSIPTLVFAAAGLSTAWLAFRASPTTWALLAGTVAAMCGLALCNVSMPSFIRENFAQKSSLMTGL